MRARLGDLVLQRGQPVARSRFLQQRLVVARSRSAHRFVYAITKLRKDEPAGGLEATVNVDRADNGFERVRDDRRLGAPAGTLFPPPETKMRTETKIHSQIGERFGAHHSGFRLGQMPLGTAGELMVEKIGDDQAKDRVAKELEPFVAGPVIVLGTPRTMRDRQLELVGITEPIPQSVLQRRQRRSGQRLKPSFAAT